MLGALDASRHQQAQLVSDAGHELRTPLTSLRTNVEFLTRAPTMPDADRTEVLRDINAQVEELTTLVGDLVELARQDETQPEPTEIRLDNLVARAVERARRRAPSLVFDVDLTAGSVRAQPPLLERAVLNVLDNATKWSPAGGTVSVRLRRHEHWTLEVRDHGPGIAAEDIPKVFDRFYRAETARAMPGSGLGLAIVNQVVRTHDGTVAIERPADGGTLVRIELPTVVEQEPGADTLARGLPPDAGDDGPPPAAAPPPALVRPPAPPPLAVPDRHGALRRALRSL
jgi:two-component system sensor histidine kinase MprB